MQLTHIDNHGKASMVDVSNKKATQRTAQAYAAVKMKSATLDLILSDQIAKGDVFACARIAGIMAAKRTAELIPLCHSLALTHINLEFQPLQPDMIEIIATAQCRERTGIEMEALCAASLAALTIYDMCKAIDRGMQIVSVHLLKKSGGKSGTYQR